jgi:hypothetical protein
MPESHEPSDGSRLAQRGGRPAPDRHRHSSVFLMDDLASRIQGISEQTLVRLHRPDLGAGERLGFEGGGSGPFIGAVFCVHGGILDDRALRPRDREPMIWGLNLSCLEFHLSVV